MESYQSACLGKPHSLHLNGHFLQSRICVVVSLRFAGTTLLEPCSISWKLLPMLATVNDVTMLLNSNRQARGWGWGGGGKSLAIHNCKTRQIRSHIKPTLSCQRGSQSQQSSMYQQVKNKNHRTSGSRREILRKRREKRRRTRRREKKSEIEI